MKPVFSADEVFEVAEAIEAQGAKFYRSAAEQVQDPEVQNMLIELALMEDVHEVNFKEMREQLSDLERHHPEPDPGHQIHAYLKAMADLNGTEGRLSVDRPLTGEESVPELLQIALDSEKDSIVFYLNLKDYVPFSRGKQRIDDIIAEELSHVTILVEALKLYA